jgi:BirA family transcriptional regulator, biotin operon repressor / biotin---[acetyl-CoA-carboxylase] ligase
MHKFFAKTIFIGKNVIFLTECHSTSTELSKLVKKSSLQTGTVVMADYQSAGKGQRANSWSSERGMNILSSILLRPSFLAIDKQFFLNILFGLAISDAIGHFIASGVKIKWPNDVYVHDHKIAGVLIEASWLRNKIDYAICGLGVNVNQTNFASLKATSLFLETGIPQNRGEVIELILMSLEKWNQLLQKRDYEHLLTAYHERLYWKDDLHLFKIDEQLIEGRIKGINPIGQLRVLIDGSEQTFDLKGLVFVA